MADEIILKYGVDTSGLKDAQKEVQKVTQLTEELHTEVKATFSDKALDEAVLKLHEQGQTMDALILRYGDANKALKAMQKELTTMAALGQRGTKEFEELAKATAELSDTIGDTRGEIKKLASDTRVFDTMVQGARGITAAFSVATGLTAALGKENEDLQKAILKVQGAMAALQGVQELANLATEKGGILTQAYGVALKGVELISKTFGISMQASWAVATAGLSVLVGGVVALIAYLRTANDETDNLKKAEEERQRQNELYAETQRNNSKEQQIEDERRRQASKSQIELATVNIDILNRQIESEKARQQGLASALLTFNEAEKQTIEYQKVYGEYLNSQQKELDLSKLLTKERENLTALLKKQQDELAKTTSLKRAKSLREMLLGKPAEEGEPLITEADVKATSGNVDKIEQAVMDLFKNRAIAQANSGGITAGQKFIDGFASALQNTQPLVSAFADLSTSLFARETQSLEEEKQKQLALAGDNASKREEIEKKFARRKAEIERQQAIVQKATSIFDIITNTAVAISAQTKGLPATAPLLALAASIGAAQIAAVAAQPLPQIPKFEKGGAVALMGGEIRRDSSIIGHSHRQGGVLIEAEGGEYITNKHAAKQYSDELKAANEFRLEDLILHKYVAPALKAAQLASAESYDDRLLRKTIKETSRENAHYIGKSVSKAVSETAYFKARYGV